MFTNPLLGDILLVNSMTNTIHAASALSEGCGINGEENGRFGILPCESKRERELMLVHLAREFPELKLCPVCFPGRGDGGASEGAEEAAASGPSASAEPSDSDSSASASSPTCEGDR